jgi:hypothetical protein
VTSQLVWLKQEAAELCQEANEAFDVVESALHQHPFFSRAPPPELAATSLAAMITAVRQDRSCFVERVSGCVRHTAAPADARRSAAAVAVRGFARLGSAGWHPAAARPSHICRVPLCTGRRGCDLRCGRRAGAER